MLFRIMFPWKNLPSEMDAGARTPRAATAALATLFLLVQLCDANTVYAEKGSSPELLCPCPSCSGTQKVSWYFVQQRKTTALFHKFSNSSIERCPVAWSRLVMLQNNSLLFNHVVDNDTGRYWCNLNHFYDLVVVTGSQQKLEPNQANSVCYVLSCFFPPKEVYRDVITWWEGRKQILEGDQMGRSSIFKGKKASQLHICLKKEALKKNKERHVKCRFAQKTEIMFRLTDNDHDFCSCSTLLPSSQGTFLLLNILEYFSVFGGHSFLLFELFLAAVLCFCLSLDIGTVKDGLSSQCSEIKRNGIPWIPLAVCVILQFLIILALLILWRRSCSQKYPDHLKKPRKDVPMSEYTPQLYENVRI
ncbi:lymphocyte antigen 6 complex locus protein G6f-like [Candoia aspera]|uniref:lymphocyte antigen 6 complex locus protein G6f-like n=1 Tax=Candoia aspera TaxID=51853 RepID=UPI002FD80A7E